MTIGNLYVSNLEPLCGENANNFAKHGHFGVNASLKLLFSEGFTSLFIPLWKKVENSPILPVNFHTLSIHYYSH